MHSYLLPSLPEEPEDACAHNQASTKDNIAFLKNV